MPMIVDVEEALTHIRKAFQEAGEIQHSVLLRRLSGRGVRAKMLTKLIKMLVEKRQITIIRKGQGTWYRWNKKF